MARIEKARLQGIGVRHDLTVADGTRIGMITYDSGERELLLYDQRDPDECRTSIAWTCPGTRSATPSRA